jgi:hypothetical protein
MLIYGVLSEIIILAENNRSTTTLRQHLLLQRLRIVFGCDMLERVFKGASAADVVLVG